MLTNTDTKFSQIFNRLTDLPTLPAVVDKLLQLSEKEASFKEFGDLISTDPGLTAKVLKLVNSAFYSLKAPVSDLAHACSMIGVRTIKSLVLSVSVMQLFKRRCEGFDSTTYWRHSLAAALTGRRIAETLGFDLEQTEEAYIAGLLHACGVPLFVQFFPEEYSEILSAVEDEDADLVESEMEVFGAGHPEAGGRVVTHWRLSPRISQAVSWQASPPDQQPADLDLTTRQLIDVVRLADLWTRRAGLPFVEALEMFPEEVIPIPDWMQLDEERLSEAIGDLLSAVSETEQLFKD